MEKRHTLGMMTISHNAGAQGGAGCIRLYNVGSCKYSGVCLVLSWYRAPSMLWKLGATAKPKPTGPPHSQCFVPVLGHKMSPKERQSGGGLGESCQTGIKQGRRGRSRQSHQQMSPNMTK